MSVICDTCGARLPEGAGMCELCGTSVDGVELEASIVEDDIVDVSDSASVFCTSCGRKNPAGANYCAKCGTELEQLDDFSSAKKKTRNPKAKQAPSHQDRAAVSGSDSEVGKRIIVIVASALLVVVALYIISSMSSGRSGSDSATALPLDQVVEEPLAPQFASRQTELQDQMLGLSGDRLIALRRELVDLYFAAGRLDLAATESEFIAKALQSEDEWSVVGNLYYDWMERKDISLRAPWARKAVGAYQEVLKLNPDNLDVRTDMAIAYMYDPQNSMMAIQETNTVLEADSLHMQANFNRGIMLMQIDRNTQAMEQFEKVKRIVGDVDDPVYQRAELLIARLNGESAAVSQ